MKRGTDTTSRLGISAIDTFFSERDWLFREQPIHDWGIDAHVEPKRAGRPTGQLCALQIKSGPSWFKSKNKNGYRHDISDEHFDYWLRHQLPVFIMLYHPEEKICIWQKVEKHLIRKTEGGNFYIRVPEENVLDDSAIPFFEDALAKDPSSFRRAHLALDYSMMKQIAAADKAYMAVSEWNHKGLSMRGASFWFSNPGPGTPDIHIDRYHPSSGIHEYMARMFPWLNYKHIRALEDSTHSIEFENHLLRVELNSIGRSFIRLEKFFTKGQEPKTYQLPYVEDDTMDEDEYDEWAYQRAMERD